MSLALAEADGFQPWRRALLWLCFLGPFFFLSYGFANGIAAGRGITDSVVFGWERQIPFWPWTIVPYWSCDLIYGLAFLLCRNRHEADRLALRLLTAQLISVACFLAFPLRFTFERPATDGVFGWFFATLAGFDQPYNQAPSLHVSLALILWDRYVRSGQGDWPWLTHAWFGLVALSTLTTYQHHFIDLPTGALAGLVCLWLWPDGQASPLAVARTKRSGVRGIGATNPRIPLCSMRATPADLMAVPARRRLAGRYLAGATGLLGIAFGLGGTALWLCWVAVALGLVALCYAMAGADGFQKQDGRHSLAVRWLAAPYLLGAWLNSRWWTRKHPQPDLIAEEVWLGRMPTAQDMAAGGFTALFDCTAELPAPLGPWRYGNLPCLDLLPPDAGQLAEAAARIEALRGQGPVLVCCALGYSRSASMVAAWLLRTGRAPTVAAAVSWLEDQRPGLVLHREHLAALAEYLARQQERPWLK